MSYKTKDSLVYYWKTYKINSFFVKNVQIPRKNKTIISSIISIAG